MSSTAHGSAPYYYVPQPSHWPMIGSIALTLTAYALVYTGLMVSFMVVVTQLALKDAQEDAGAAAPSAAVTPTPAT